MGDDSTFQPKSVIQHDVDFISNIQRYMGVVNFDISYDNFNSAGKLGYQITYLVEEAINQKNINLRKREDLIPNVEAVYKLRQLWHGQCFLTVEHGQFGAIPQTELFHYDTSKINFNNPNLEVITIPALSNMTPIGQIKEDTLLIEIHESIPCKYAWQGLSYADVVQDGLMIHSFNDGSQPKISLEQMESITDLTRLISRDVYFRLIHKEKNKYIRLWSILYNNYSKIIEFVKLDDDEDEDYHRPSLTTTKKLIR
mgnify:FL=1